MPAQQYRWFLLTIPRDLWTPCLPDGVTYIRGQPERGDESGYAHWQVCAYFAAKITLSGAKRVFPPESHLEPTRSAAALAYVWKDETRDGEPFAFGEPPMRRNEPTDWDKVWDAATRGDMLSIPADVRVRCYRTITAIACDFARPLAQERSSVVYWGATGTGKSRRAYLEAGIDCYFKDPRTKFWCGYRGQEHVVLDEFRGVIDVANLLRWLDRYPVLVETKGSAVPLRALKFWFTSNIPPIEWYPGLDPATFAALERRLEVILIE